MFYIRYENTPGSADATFQYGAPGHGALPVAGKWPGVPAPQHGSIGIYAGDSFDLK